MELRHIAVTENKKEQLNQHLPSLILNNTSLEALSYSTEIRESP